MAVLGKFGSFAHRSFALSLVAVLTMAPSCVSAGDSAQTHLSCSIEREAGAATFDDAAFCERFRSALASAMATQIVSAAAGSASASSGGSHIASTFRITRLGMIAASTTVTRTGRASAALPPVNMSIMDRPPRESDAANLAREIAKGIAALD